MKQVAVLGLGDFGSALVRELKGNKVSVLAADIDRTRAEALKDLLDHVVILDMTKAAALEQLGLAQMDAVVVATSAPMSTSVLTVLRLKELGVKHIIAKAENEDHAKVLQALGVEQVVLPEHEAANRLANRVSWTNVVEMVELSSGCNIMEVAAPQKIVGKLLCDSNLRQEYHVIVLAIRSKADAELEAIPSPDRVITEACTLVVFGEERHLAKLRKEVGARNA